MGELCRIAQVRPHTLRYWERRVGLLRPARRASGHRRYTREDLETVLAIKELVEKRKMTLAGARRALLERKRGSQAPGPEGGPASGRGAGASPAMLKLLREVRREIQALVEELKG